MEVEALAEERALNFSEEWGVLAAGGVKAADQFAAPGETRTKSFCPKPGGNRFCGMLKLVLVAGQLAAFQVPATVQDWRVVVASIL